jgi:hypothetical protein
VSAVRSRATLTSSQRKHHRVFNELTLTFEASGTTARSALPENAAGQPRGNQRKKGGGTI